MALVEGREHVVISNIEQLFVEKNKEIADLKDINNQKGKTIADLQLAIQKEIENLQFEHEKEIEDLKLDHKTTFETFQTETKQAMEKVQADNNKIFADLQQKIEILQGNHAFNLYSFVKDNFYDGG